VLGQRTVNDPPPGGNGNGRFDPGETGELLAAIRNVGNEAANSVTGLLRSGDARFVLTDSTSSYGDIVPGGSVIGDAYVAEVSSSIQPETPIPLTLFITGSNYSDTLSFTVVIGELRPVDPVPDGPRQPARYWAYDDVDVQYAQHPEFSWVEIRDRGTRLTLSDDQTVQVDLPTGFVWNYYGQTYGQLSICGNGWVAPGYTTSSSYTNTALPTTSMPAVVCLVWDDLYPPYGNSVWYYHDAANHRFIIEYDSVHYYGARDQWDKYELIVYDTTVHTPTGDNVLLVQYLTANGYTSMTAGIQDPSMTIAIQCLFDGIYHRGAAPLVPGRAIKYTTVDPSIGIAEQPGRVVARAIRAWPNPFTNSVRFDLNPRGIESSTPSVSIFDNSGRHVRTLTGTTWDGRDQAGKLLSPGIYFCRIGSGNTEFETKLVLTR
jgi:hypothetical protein